MPTMFADPVLVEVFAEDGDAVRFVATHRNMPYRKSTTVEALNEDLARHLCRVASASHSTVGAVVFNAGTDRLPPLHFFVATESRMRDADDEDEAVAEEVTEAIERHWEGERAKWAKKNKVPRRLPTRAAQPVPAIREYDDDPQPAAEALPPVETYEPPAPRFAPAPDEDLQVGVAEQPPAIVVGDLMAEHQPILDSPPARASVRDLPSLMAEGKQEQHAQEGWRSSVNALGLRLPPGKDEARRRKLAAAILAGWDGPKVLTLLNEKGSGGKTPWALMIAAAMQRYGRGRVAVRDGNPTGNADERADFFPPVNWRPGELPLNDRDLARYFLEEQVMVRGAVERFLHQHRADKYGLVSHHVPSDDHDQLAPEEVDASLDALIEDHLLVINDSGNNPYERRDVAMLQRTDHLVLPFLTYPDRENGARKTLDRLERWGSREGGEHYAWLQENATAVVNVAEDSREHRARAEKWADRWQPLVRQVTIAPFDRHMASHNLRFEDLKLPTRTAVLEVAAGAAGVFRSA